MAATQTNIKDMPGKVGKKLGTSDWVEITQDRINMFADATGDHQWIHVDPERCAKEFPGGKTIAHGYLTLSLLPMLLAQINQVTGVKNGINYGSNKVRFTNQVPVGSRIRAHQTLTAADWRKDGALQMTSEVQIEVEGQERPALVAESLGLVYPA